MATKKFTGLGLLAAASITATDIVAVVDDVAGTPASYKAAMADLRSAILKGTGGASAGWTGADYLALGAGTLPASGRLRFALGSITIDDPLLNATATWNATGVTFRGLVVNITDTASAAASTFADFQIGGTTKWKVDKAGAVTQTGALTVGGATALQALTATSALVRAATSTTIGLDTSTGAASDNTQLQFLRGATLKWRVGTNIDGSNVDRFQIYNDPGTAVMLTLTNTTGVLLLGAATETGAGANELVLGNGKSLRGANATNTATASLIQRNAAGVVLIDADNVGAATTGLLIVGASLTANGLIQANAGLTIGAGALTIASLAGAGTGVVSAGANNSAGAGFRWLVLPNG